MTTLARARMAHPPIIIYSENSVPEAARLMRQHGFRRLPVVDGTRLIGIVTDRDLKEAMPSDATSLSIREISYLLGELKVKQVMTTTVLTAADDMRLTDAAEMMFKHQIGGLPVIDQRHQLVGMLAVSDVLREYVGSAQSIST